MYQVWGANSWEARKEIANVSDKTKAEEEEEGEFVILISYQEFECEMKMAMDLRAGLLLSQKRSVWLAMVRNSGVASGSGNAHHHLSHRCVVRHHCKTKSLRSLDLSLSWRKIPSLVFSIKTPLS